MRGTFKQVGTCYQNSIQAHASQLLKGYLYPLRKSEWALSNKLVLPKLDPCKPITAMGMGLRCKFLNGVWGGAPAAIDSSTIETKIEAVGTFYNFKSIAIVLAKASPAGSGAEPQPPTILVHLRQAYGAI